MAVMCVLMAAILLLCYSGHLFSSSVDGRTGGASHIAHKTHICSEYPLPVYSLITSVRYDFCFPGVCGLVSVLASLSCLFLLRVLFVVCVVYDFGHRLYLCCC